MTKYTETLATIQLPREGLGMQLVIAGDYEDDTLVRVWSRLENSECEGDDCTIINLYGRASDEDEAERAHLNR